MNVLDKYSRLGNPEMRSGLASTFVDYNKPLQTNTTFDLSFLDSLNSPSSIESSINDFMKTDKEKLVPAVEGIGENGIFSNPNLAGNVAGLASAFTSLISLPDMLKNAKLQNKSLAFNLSTAKEEQGRRNTMIRNINKVGT